MDPKQPQTPQAELRKPAPPQTPTFSLSQLAALFLRDRNDKALDGVARTFAQRMHQIVLHMQILSARIAALGKARQADLKQIDENFQQIGTLIEQLPIAAAPSGGSEGGQEAAPPIQQEPPPDPQSTTTTQ